LKINIGIFGAGSFGETHIKVLQTINNFNIIGFYEPNKKRTQEIIEKFQIKGYENAKSLIKECDAIDIVSETSTHHTIIKESMKFNKHIFIEKPICAKKEELEDLLKNGKKYPRIIQVGHIERYNPIIIQGFQNVKNIISINTIRTGPLNARNQNISITTDLMIHDIDLIISLVSSELIKIEATGPNNKNQVNHHVECNFFFKNGIVANLISSRNERMKNERKITINCKEKIIELDLINKIQKEVDKEIIKTLNCNNDINPLKQEFIAFYDSITKMTKPKVGIKEGCQALEIALKIDELITKNNR
tara:strand:- start:1141 stop:2055 length:915 start_codon:yes stop_codon:yes gene_type:complete